MGEISWAVFWLGLFVCVALLIASARDYYTNPTVVCMTAKEGYWQVPADKDFTLKCLESLNHK